MFIICCHTSYTTSSCSTCLVSINCVYSFHMFKLILLLVVGSVMAYLSQNNLMLVPLHLGTYTFSDIPLFYIIIGSLITGLGLAYLIYLFNSIFTTFSIHGKDTAIKQGKSDIIDLTKRIHQLELENERLKNNSTVIEPQDSNAL